ncbi:hypothetical protein NECAME_03131 [Necator americanus]|uniref:Uncharacterized protein n=1 Tax=Necator americanus TaxID=51031 RepID=W2T761_NECAM|nr:hypothetical protein NECAME_03131 [Necator americanus]ETN77713.1 hypothetical protein NECAME_03131 [Necator americanus]
MASIFFFYAAKSSLWMTINGFFQESKGSFGDFSTKFSAL